VLKALKQLGDSARQGEVVEMVARLKEYLPGLPCQTVFLFGLTLLDLLEQNGETFSSY
jgi:hypothetical protein